MEIFYHHFCCLFLIANGNIYLVLVLTRYFVTAYDKIVSQYLDSLKFDLGAFGAGKMGLFITLMRFGERSTSDYKLFPETDS